MPDLWKTPASARSYLVGPSMYALCLAITWWNVRVSLAINGGMTLYFLLSPSLRAKERPDWREPGGPLSPGFFRAASETMRLHVCARWLS